MSGYEHPLPASITQTGYLDLSGYEHPLPASITQTGNLDLRGYEHPLPASITQTGNLYLRGYEHPLPASITQTGYLDLRGYEHPLPASIKCSSIKIDNTGPWGIEINLRKISIGCKTKYTDGWKEFFKNKSFYETSPSSEQYQFIVNDFHKAIEIQEKYKDILMEIN